MQDLPPKKDNTRKSSGSNLSFLLQYAALGGQMLAAIGIALFLGMKADAYFRLSRPLLSWVFPLLVLTGMMIKIVKETNRK